MLKSFLNKSSEDNCIIDETNIPQHVAIIMDGNGRWAKRYGLPRAMGHRKGAEVLRSIVIAAKDLGIKALTVYGFSTENWKRPAKEVQLLMALIKEYLAGNIIALHENNIRIRFIGDRLGLSEDIQEMIEAAEAQTRNNTALTLHLAVNYGGRLELTQALQKVAEEVKAGTMNPEDITEEIISSHLYAPDFPEVDLLIRPSNDARISNFLLWQLAYAEFWFTEKHWPEFTKETLEEAILAYQGRERRFGGLKED